MKRTIAALAISSFAATAHADSLSPTLVFDGDYRLNAHTEVEGFDGLALARMQAGARADLTPDITTAGLVDFASGESPTIVDAFVSWRNRGSRLSGGYLRSPLFPSARDEFVEQLPIPEEPQRARPRRCGPGRAVRTVHALAPGDAAAGHLVSRRQRIGDFVSGNDTNYPAIDARVDYVIRRTRTEVNYGHDAQQKPRAATCGESGSVPAHTSIMSTIVPALPATPRRATSSIGPPSSPAIVTSSRGMRSSSTTPCSC